jgi:hypothetical protein
MESATESLTAFLSKKAANCFISEPGKQRSFDSASTTGAQAEPAAARAV